MKKLEQLAVLVWNRSEKLTGWVLFVASMAAYAMVHQMADLTFPVPWPDEASFLWPAHALATANSLFAPQLNPDRTLFWMPPGYTVIMGAVFKFTGTSLLVARHTSMLFVAAAVALIFLRARSLVSTVWAGALTGIFLLGPHFVSTGNLARMEALVFLGAAISFLLIDGPLVLPSLALLLVLPLVHPGGAYFAAGGAVFAVAAFPRIRPHLSWRGAGILVVPMLFWAAYGVYALANWEPFRTDMYWQYLHKFEPRLQVPLLTLPNAITALFLAGAAWRTWRAGNLRALAWTCFAGAAWILPITSFSMWYKFYGALGALLLSVLLVHVIESELAQFRPSLRIAAAGLAALGCLGLAHRNGLLKSPYPYPGRLSFEGMVVLPDDPYLTKQDIAVIRAKLESIASQNHPPTVEVYPWADALFFQELEGRGIRFFAPNMHPDFTVDFARSKGAGLTSTAVPDVYVVHASRSFPTLITNQLAMQFTRAGIDPSDKGLITYSRGTETWYIKRRGPE